MAGLRYHRGRVRFISISSVGCSSLGYHSAHAPALRCGQPCACRNRLAALLRRRDKAHDDPANGTTTKAARPCNTTTAPPDARSWQPPRAARRSRRALPRGRSNRAPRVRSFGSTWTSRRSMTPMIRSSTRPIASRSPSGASPIASRRAPPSARPSASPTARPRSRSSTSTAPGRQTRRSISSSTVGRGAPTVDEDIDRRVCLPGAVDVELLDLGRAVGDALGRADGGARLLAIGDAPLGDLLAIGRVDDLIIGVIERLLVHVEPNERTLGARLLRPRGSARRDRRAARGGCQDRASGGAVVVLHGRAAFVVVPLAGSS